MQRLYPEAHAARLPAPDGELQTTMRGPVLVQVVDALDIQTSISAQLQKLYQARDRVEDLAREDKEDDEDSNTGSKMLRYTVRDMGGTLLYLFYNVAPSQLPQLGSFLMIENCELHRGILVATDRTVKVLPHKEEISIDAIAKLEAFLGAQST